MNFFNFAKPTRAYNLRRSKFLKCSRGWQKTWISSKNQMKIPVWWHRYWLGTFWTLKLLFHRTRKIWFIVYFPCGHRILLCSFIFHAAIQVEIRKNFMILSNHFLSKLRNDAFYYRSEDWKRDCTDFCFPKRDPCPRKTLKRSTDIQIFETFLCNLESVDNPNTVFYLGIWITSFNKGYTFRKKKENK